MGAAVKLGMGPEFRKTGVDVVPVQGLIGPHARLAVDLRVADCPVS